MTIVNVIKANKSGVIYFLQIKYFKTREKILTGKRKEQMKLFTYSVLYVLVWKTW